ncbi:hypothetical protein EJB05_44641, partial [Eragrostis curvula]
MEFTMEVVASAVVSEIVGRIFSCVIDNFRGSCRARDAHRQRLEALLLDIGSKVEEAEGRHITNLRLLAQLKVVTGAMHRGRFALELTDLDNDAAAEEEATATTGKRKLAALRPQLNALKRARLILGGGDSTATEKRLASVVEELETVTRDHMRSFIEMVMGYPRRNSVPRAVTTTLFMDRCVFGRHVETERVVAFLLQPAPRSTGLSVLAVVGDPQVGKTTLVKHACDDERVRSHFARVEWFYLNDVVNAGLQPGQTKWTVYGPEYLTGMRRILDEPRFSAVDRSLLVFHHNIIWPPIDESAWAALLATSNLPEGSKLIFIGENGEAARTIGTVEPMVLRPLPEEEYWYYFKAFAFGGTGPQDHQRMASVGREISRHLGSSFLDARFLGELLRANFDARFWRRVLAIIVKRQGNGFGPVHSDVLANLLSIRGWNWLYGCHEREIPPKTKLTLQDVLRAAATSSSGSGLGGDDMEEAFTIYCGQGLYTDRSHTIVLEKDGWSSRNGIHAEGLMSMSMKVSKNSKRRSRGYSKRRVGTTPSGERVRPTGQCEHDPIGHNVFVTTAKESSESCMPVRRNSSAYSKKFPVHVHEGFKEFPVRVHEGFKEFPVRVHEGFKEISGLSMHVG